MTEKLFKPRNKLFVLNEPMDMLRINTIYKAIEGEGSNIGYPEIFIRTQSCHVGCNWCDSKETWRGDDKAGHRMKTNQIIDRCRELSDTPGRVHITGGEPLEQKNIWALIMALKNIGYYVILETSGQIMNEEVFDVVDFISFDIKTPSSGVEPNWDVINYILEKLDSMLVECQFKAVIANWDDYNFIKKNMANLKNSLSENKLILTPSWPLYDEEIDKQFVRELVDRVLADELDVRIILQQHKMLYGHQENR